MGYDKALPEGLTVRTLLGMFGEEYNQITMLAARVDEAVTHKLDAAARESVQQAIGGDVVEVLLGAVFDVLGGQKPHIPTAPAFYGGLARTVRDEEIRARFKGNNLAELSEDTGLTTRQLRNIVAGRARQYKRPQEEKRPAKLTAGHYAAVNAISTQHMVPICQVLEVLLDVALSAPDIEQQLRAAFPQVVMRMAS